MNKRSLIITVITTCIIICLIAYACKLKHSISIYEHNASVMHDSIETLTLKNGEHVSTINSYIIEKNQLSQCLDLDKQTIKELEKKLHSSVAHASSIDARVVYDTIATRDTIVVRDDVTTYNIIYSDKWLSLSGRSIIKDSIATTSFNTISISTPIQVGLTEDYQIWVKSDNPYLKISNIKSFVVDGSKIKQKTKRWGLGLQLGVGMQYGGVNKHIDIGPYIGVGISYNILTW